MSERGETRPLAILCGGGGFPLEVARAAQAGGRPPFLVGVVGSSDPAIEAFAHVWVHMGQVGKMFAALKERATADIAIVGAMTRPEFADLRLDWGALKRAPDLAQLFRGGDNRLLVGIAGIFEREGLRVVGAHEIAPQLLAPMGPIGARAVSREAEADARSGAAVLAALSPFDAGQGVVVANGRVIAIEAAEGTDAMLARVAELRALRRLRFQGAAGVFVKARQARSGPASRHARRGPEDDRGRRARAQLQGVALAAGQVLIADRQAVSRAADEARACSSSASRHERAGARAARRADRGRAFGRSTRLQADAGAARADGRGSRIPRRRRRSDGGRRAEEPVPDERHRGDGHLAGHREIADLARAHSSDRSSAIIAARPDALVIIDSPDFTHRVARRVRRALPDLPSSTTSAHRVWAWRPGRAKAMRAYVDCVLALLPFEPDAHARLGGPRCVYVGHPLIERLNELRPNADEARRRAAAPPVIVALPGSRRSVIARLIDGFRRRAGAARARFRLVRARPADPAACRERGARARGKLAASRRASKSARRPSSPRFASRAPRLPHRGR